MQREYRYIYGAVSPFDGEIDWAAEGMMNTANMAKFLRQLAEAYPGDYPQVVLDGCSHTTAKLGVPENMEFLALPPDSRELNSVENLWNELRKKACGNRMVDAVVVTLEKMTAAGLEAAKKISSMFCWPLMIRSI